MKNLVNYLIESNVEKKNTTVAHFAKWACLGDYNSGVKSIEPEDCKVLLDSGWSDNFDDSDPDKACKEIAKFLNDNWNEQIKVTSKKTYGGWDVSFTLNNDEYVAGFMVKYLESEYSAYKSKK